MVKFLFVIAILAQSVTFQNWQPIQPNAQCDLESPASPILWTCVDWVAPDAGVIAAWSLNFKTGHAPSSITLVSFNEGFISTQLIRVPRPDVANAFGVIDQSLGWGLIADHPLSPGTYAIFVSDMPYTQTCGYDPNNGQWCGFVTNMVEFTIN